MSSRLSQATAAVKEALPAKVLLSGPSGSGKTYSALLAAEVFAGAGRILVIDTERKSSSYYADLAQFDAIDWHPPYDPRELADTLREAAGKYTVVIIDSLSHFWMGEGGTLAIVDDASKRAKGNTYVGWSEGTPAQNRLYEAILSVPCHVIACSRSKTEYVLEEGRNGKQVPHKVGMAPIQRDGIEYEFTVQLDLDHEHNAAVGKTRCPALADKLYRPGQTKEWARTLVDWLNSGTAPKEATPLPSTPCPESCGYMGPDKPDVAQHLVTEHGWVRTEDGKVRPPQAPSAGGELPPARSDSDATPPASSESAGAGPSSGAAGCTGEGPAAPGPSSDAGLAASRSGGEGGPAPEQRQTERVSASEGSPPGVDLSSARKLSGLFAALRDGAKAAGLDRPYSEDERHAWASHVLGKDVATFTRLTTDEVQALTRQANAGDLPPVLAKEKARPADGALL